MKLPAVSDAYTVAKLWFVFCVITLSAFILTQKAGYLQGDTLGIWILSCLAILYLSRRETGLFPDSQKKLLIISGILVCVLSFFSIPIGITNPPYSIGEFSLLLSGFGIILFGILGYRSLILPVSIPFIAVIGFGLYELFIRNQDWITAPLIPYIIFLTISLLNLLGIQAVANGNIVSFISLTGAPIYLSIVSDCTGIWSLGTFTVAVIVVLSSFPESISKRSMVLIAVGYIGTFCMNIIRILLIALSGYFFGPKGVIEEMHVHIGWICFSLWMIIFWYYFFTRQLGITIFKKKEEKEDVVL